MCQKFVSLGNAPNNLSGSGAGVLVPCSGRIADTIKTIAFFMATPPVVSPRGTPLNFAPCSAPHSLAEIGRFSTFENFPTEVRRRLVFVQAR